MQNLFLGLNMKASELAESITMKGDTEVVIITEDVFSYHPLVVEMDPNTKFTVIMTLE